jgi:hypothetical protein
MRLEEEKRLTQDFDKPIVLSARPADGVFSYKARTQSTAIFLIFFFFFLRHVVSLLICRQHSKAMNLPRPQLSG